MLSFKYPLFFGPLPPKLPSSVIFHFSQNQVQTPSHGIQGPSQSVPDSHLSKFFSHLPCPIRFVLHRYPWAWVWSFARNLFLSSLSTGKFGVGSPGWGDECLAHHSSARMLPAQVLDLPVQIHTFASASIELRLYLPAQCLSVSLETFNKGLLAG